MKQVYNQRVSALQPRSPNPYYVADRQAVCCLLSRPLQQVTVLRNVKVKVEGSYPGLPCLRATTVPPDRLLCLTRDVRGALPHTRRHGASVRWTLNIRRRLQPTPLPVNVSDSLEDFSIEREKGEKSVSLCNVTMCKKFVSNLFL